MSLRLTLALILLGTGLSFGQGTDATNPSRSRTSSDPTITIVAGQSYQFTVPGPVVWSLQPPVGSITDGGLYTAPDYLTSSQRVVVAASNPTVPSQVTLFNVLVVPEDASTGVSVQPNAVELIPGQSQQFTADSPVVWALIPTVGSITPTGLYTAPNSVQGAQSVEIVALNVLNPSKVGKATVTIRPASLSVSPAAVALSVGQSQRFTASEPVTWSLTPPVGTVSPDGLYTAPDTLAAAQTVTIAATSQSNSSVSASATISLQVDSLTVAPVAVSLGPGQGQLFTASQPVSWSLNPVLGSITAGGQYTAPAQVSEAATVTVRAVSTGNPSIVATASVSLAPESGPGDAPASLTISPSTVTLKPAETVAFSASGAGPFSWKIAPSNLGTIDANGTYRAPTTISSTQTVTVTVSSGSQSANATVTLQPVQPGGPVPPTNSVISNLQVNGIGHGSAQISFTTQFPDPNTSLRIDYGRTPSLGFRTVESTWGSGSKADRSRVVAGLMPGTRYYFRPVVSDGSGKLYDSWVCPSVGTSTGYTCESIGALPYFVTNQAPSSIPVAPQLPERVSVSVPAINGQTFMVSVDDSNECVDFQEKLDQAAAANPSLNHQVLIPQGATCFGEFQLPLKQGSGTVLIRPTTPDSLLPAPGVRVDPSLLPRLATISLPPDPRAAGRAFGREAIRTSPKCSPGSCTEGWYFLGIEITHPHHTAFPRKLLKIKSIEGTGNPVVTVDQPHGLVTHNVIYVAGVPSAGVNGVRRVGVLTSPTSFRLVGADVSAPVSPGDGYIVWALSIPIDSCSNTTPIVCSTSMPHGLASNSDRPVQVWGVGGNTAANGSHLFKVLDNNRIQLTGTNGNGSHTGSGFLTQNPDLFMRLIATVKESGRIVFDRCYIHGQGFPTRLNYGISLNAHDSALVNSFVENVGVWGSIDPVSGRARGGDGGLAVEFIDARRLKISNNAFVNNPGISLFAQDHRKGPDMTPSDVEISRNLFFKSDRLRAGSPISDGRYYPVRHSIEFKNGQRILIDGNIFDGNWADHVPTGPTILLGARAHRTFKDNTIRDATITNNVFRRASHGIYVFGDDGISAATLPLARIKISNNLFSDINFYEMRSTPSGVNGAGSSSNAAGAVLWASSGIEDLEFTHNTVYDNRGKSTKLDYWGGRSSGFVVQYNILTHNHDSNAGGLPYGNRIGNSVEPPVLGSAAEVFRAYFTQAPDPDPNSRFSDNVIIPGVKDSSQDANYSSSAANANFTKSDCEGFYAGFENIECVDGATASQRLASVFPNTTTFRPRSFESFAEQPGANISALETALGMSVSDTAQLVAQIESSSPGGGGGSNGGSGSPPNSDAAALRGDPAEIAKQADLASRARSRRTGGALIVADGQDLEARLAAASCGDKIVLPAGEVIRLDRPATLPAASCGDDNPIVILSSAIWTLPTGRRITETDLPLLARLQTTDPEGVAFFSSPLGPAAGVAFRGIEFASTSGGAGPLLSLSPGDRLTLEHCYLHGPQNGFLENAITSGAAGLVVRDSLFRGFSSLDSSRNSATISLSGSGEALITNSDIEAATSALRAQGDWILTLTGSRLTRPLSRNYCHSSWDGLPHVVETLVSAQGTIRARIESNLLENHWSSGAASGEAIRLDLLELSDLQIRFNELRNVFAAVGVAGLSPSPTFAFSEATKVSIEQNVVDPGYVAPIAGLCSGGTVDGVFRVAEDWMRSVNITCNTLLGGGGSRLNPGQDPGCYATQPW